MQQPALGDNGEAHSVLQSEEQLQSVIVDLLHSSGAVLTHGTPEQVPTTCFMYFFALKSYACFFDRLLGYFLLTVTVLVHRQSNTTLETTY